MKGLELLVIGQKYVVRTQFITYVYKNLVFKRFFKENDDVTLAIFTNHLGFEICFDISLPTNVVELAIK